MTRWAREGARASIVIVLLVLTFVTTAVIAVRAQLGAKRERRTAENVIADWTRVAADELARRTEAQAGYYGTYPVLQLLGKTPRLLGPAEILAAAKNDEEQRNARLVKLTFSYAPATRTMASIPPIDAPTQSTLGARLPAKDDEPVHIGERVFVSTKVANEVRGFEVDKRALAPFFANAMAIRPLLPRSLAAGHIENEAIATRVVDAQGRVLFTSSGESGIRVVHHPEEGLLRGMSVEAAIAPPAAQRVLGGAVPQSLPVYALLLALNGVLLLTAILQIRKERALSRLRSDFVADVSHELRTPLAQIRMFTETLQLDRIRSDDERKNSLAIIDQESRRLAQLVDNVLQFSRGERGTMTVSRRRTDVAEAARAAVASFLPIAASRNATVVVDAERETIVNADEDALRQVILNLLDNAVKYGPDGQEVKVEVRRSSDRVSIAVEDEGPGVPPAERQRVWRRYERLERDRERAIAGAGIGLAVVRRIVELHGGRASCEEGTRGGARFVIDLPAESAL